MADFLFLSIIAECLSFFPFFFFFFLLAFVLPVIKNRLSHQRLALFQNK